MSEHRIIPLQRNMPFPADYRGFIYAFDIEDASEARLEVMRRQARSLAEIMNGGPVGPVVPEGATWRVADTAHASFGLEIPASVIGSGEHFLTRGRAGLVAFEPDEEDDRDWVLAKLVVTEELQTWRQAKWAGAGRDPRLLGDLRVAGAREMSFLDALGRSRPAKTSDLPGWPHPGERAAFEFLKTLKMSGLEWISHHNDFVNKSGISKTAGITRAHRRVSESLALLMQWDQIDPCNSACAESLIRFLLAIESAVRRNPRAPDFSLFDEISGHGLDEVGGLQLPGFTKWVADLQRDKAQVLKQQRLWQEEQGKQHQHYDAAPAGPPGGGKASGGGAARGKGNKRGGGGGGRGGGGAADP